MLKVSQAQQPFDSFVRDCFFSSRRRHTMSLCDWSSDVCSSDLFHSQQKTPFLLSIAGRGFLLPMKLVVTIHEPTPDRAVEVIRSIGARHDMVEVRIDAFGGADRQSVVEGTDVQVEVHDKGKA